MGTHNICLYKEVDKKNTNCNLKTMELLGYALIGVCAVIRSNMVCCRYSLKVPRQGASNEYPQHMFLWRNMKKYYMDIRSYLELCTSHSCTKI